MAERFAIISDIHSNIEALTAVFARIDQLGVNRICCLGDIVGYGPDPEPCIDLIRERCEFILRGNHDDAIFNGAGDFNVIARDVIRWTREVLRPGIFNAVDIFRPGKKERWAFLRDLRPRHQVGDLLFVHGSPRDPVREYVMRGDVYFAPAKLQEIFDLIPRACFVGHTHQPGVFIEGQGHRSPTELKNHFAMGGEKILVNVGSVGQPRDGDTRSCFAVVEQGGGGQLEVQFERVAYDYEETMRKIRANDKIDDLCAERLQRGK
ncbi:MAG: metallophosphoesterase family protein [Planctomycetota bacterium]